MTLFDNIFLYLGNICVALSILLVICGILLHKYNIYTNLSFLRDEKVTNYIKYMRKNYPLIKNERLKKNYFWAKRLYNWGSWGFVLTIVVFLIKTFLMKITTT